MAHLSEIYITKEKLQTLLNVLEKKGENGIGITLSVNDESNEYGQNIGAYVTQTKEQREAKKDRFYVGNGKVFWTDGKITLADKKAKEQPHEEEPTDDLPF